MSTPVELDMKTPVPLDDNEFIEVLAEDIYQDKKKHPSKFKFQKPNPKKLKKKKKPKNYKSMSTNNYNEIYQDRYTNNTMNKPIINNNKPIKKLGPRDIGIINTTNWKPIEINNNKLNNNKINNIKKIEKKLGPIDIGNNFDYIGIEYKNDDNNHFLKERLIGGDNGKHNEYCDKTCQCNLHYKQGPIEIGRINYQYKINIDKNKKKNGSDNGKHKRNVSQPNMVLHGDSHVNGDSNEDIEKFINSMKEFSMSLKILEDDQIAFNKEVGGFLEESKNKDKTNDNNNNNEINKSKSLDEVINDIENETGNLILDKVSEL